MKGGSNNKYEWETLNVIEFIYPYYTKIKEIYKIQNKKSYDNLCVFFVVVFFFTKFKNTYVKLQQQQQ